jgi:hypothetical protein
MKDQEKLIFYSVIIIQFSLLFITIYYFMIEFNSLKNTMQLYKAEYSNSLYTLQKEISTYKNEILSLKISLGEYKIIIDNLNNDINNYRTVITGLNNQIDNYKKSESLTLNSNNYRNVIIILCMLASVFGLSYGAAVKLLTTSTVSITQPALNKLINTVDFLIVELYTKLGLTSGVLEFKGLDFDGYQFIVRMVNGENLCVLIKIGDRYLSIKEYITLIEQPVSNTVELVAPLAVIANKLLDF